MSEATTDLATGGATDATWEGTDERGGLSRRNVLRISAAGAAAFGLGAGRLLLEPSLAQRGLASANGVFGAASIAWADLLYTEVFPTSPLILEPFKDALNVPKAARPVAQGTYSGWAKPPGPGKGQQNSLGNETHQIWPSQVGYPDPIVYKLDTLVRTHAFTT